MIKIKNVFSSIIIGRERPSLYSSVANVSFYGKSANIALVFMSIGDNRIFCVSLN